MDGRATAAGVILVAGLISGCGLLAGRGAVAPEFVRRELGCDPDELLGRARALRRGLGDPDRVFTPRVGWNACALLAHNGLPSRARRERDRPATERREELLYWWYEEAPGEGLAVLARIGCAGGCARNESPWRVVFVRW